MAFIHLVTNLLRPYFAMEADHEYTPQEATAAVPHHPARRCKFIEPNPFSVINLAMNSISWIGKKVSDPMPQAIEEEPNDAIAPWQVVTTSQFAHREWNPAAGRQIPPGTRIRAAPSRSAAPACGRRIGNLGGMGVMKNPPRRGHFVADGPPEFGKTP